ncbi:hypothetical protein [Clostridium estertheticum]|uniref:Uncharacterized protein n=1 Tax=Clostridium estertheticum TaxID=238834 RepID=A0AA47I6N3_9CLOT|nr:hypothetical protein [Clostridium estertheticum]MBU3156337.1 hypothetical protein [Clostridium estertheticum]WAG59604.1 hypothetical protein LL038_18510 [Clostridium estertheticum]
MSLYKYFKEDYEKIIEMDNDVYKSIDAFSDVLVEGEKRKYSEPLVEVFIHKTKSEMFLVLDCFDLDVGLIEKICDEWQDRVLNFVNFGKEYRDRMEFLKYNISLIILCKNEIGNKDDNFRFEAEKSIKICRKLFLICNNKGEINNDDKAMIPFYFAAVEPFDNDKIEKMERELENLLPKDIEIDSICKKEKLESEDINKLYRWLSEIDNNN